MEKTPIERIWRGTDRRDVDLILGREVVSLDPQKKTVKDDKGKEYQYDKLLLATGGTPIRLKNSSPRIIYYRTLADYRHLRELTEKKQRFAVIGGGYIGSEIAAALKMNGKDVMMVFPEAGIGARLFPEDLSTFMNDYYREKGVEVINGKWVDKVTEEGDEFVIYGRGGEEWRVDAVIAGLGIRPNTALAEQAGLYVDNGIVVDSSMRTTEPDIYAAGDVANFPTVYLVDRLRVEHEENANLSGMLAGQAMAGQGSQYGTLPMAYSDLFDLGYESVGEINPRLEVVTDWEKPYEKGVIYYLKDGRVAGVLTMGMFGKMNEARDLIAEPGPFTAKDLEGKIHS